MIDAVKALNLMPSMQRRKRQQEDRLNEISELITEAAKNDRENIAIPIYDYEEYYITKTLKDRGFRVIKMPDTEQTNGSNYRFKYLISWR